MFNWFPPYINGGVVIKVFGPITKEDINKFSGN